MILSLFFSTPFSLVTLTCWVCARIINLAIQTWWELLMTTISFCLHLAYNSMLSVLYILTFPIRLFTAFYRQFQLEQQVREMKAELEILDCENKELGQCLQIAVKETSIVEKIFQDIEDDYEKAIAKITLLQNEIHDFKRSEKASWDWKSSTEEDKITDITPWSNDGRDQCVPPLLAKSQGGCEGESKERGVLALPGREEEQKAFAVRRSLFSAALSILVGITIWEAEEPCMPLLAALVTVVGMSMSTVINFFLSINNKSASDAVLLLSINCFMLGALTRPALPRIAHASFQCALRVMAWFFYRLGFSS